MNFVFSGIFWGVMLVLLGASMIAKTVFKIDIPIFRMVFAIIIIYWGIKLLLGTSLKKTDENTVMFDNARISQVSRGGEFNVIFGKSIIDLNSIEFSEDKSEVEINVIFGSGEILLDSDIPAIINVSTVFGEGRLPKGSASFISDYVYKSPAFSEDSPFLKVELNIIFGSAVVRD